MGLSFQPQGPIICLTIISVLRLESEVDICRGENHLACRMCLATGKRTPDSQGLKDKVFTD